VCVWGGASDVCPLSRRGRTHQLRWAARPGRGRGGGGGGGGGQCAGAVVGEQQLGEAQLPVRHLLTRRARKALGTATQCTCMNDSPPAAEG
jgi:hypothetical protein